MSGDAFGIGESIKVTVVKAAPEFTILPFMLLITLVFFAFLCYKAWKGRAIAPTRGVVRQFELED